MSFCCAVLRLLYCTFVINLLVRCEVSELFVTVMIFFLGVCFEHFEPIFVVAIKLIDV